MSAVTTLDTGICPLCGRSNHCELAAHGNHEGPCWCWGFKAAPEALARVPMELRHKACLCRDCLLRTDWTDLPAPADA